MVNGLFYKLCTLALWLALHIFATKNKKNKQNKILLITNISNYISFPPQIAYKLIEAGRSKDILQIKNLSIDGLNNRENTTYNT